MDGTTSFGTSLPGATVARLAADASGSAARRAGTVTLLAGGGGGAAPSPDEALEAARAFERLLVKDMLRAMRRTIPTESPSNARSLYEDMLDERLAETLGEAGGLGLAPHIARAIERRGGAGAGHDGPDAIGDAAGRDATASVNDTVTVPRAAKGDAAAASARGLAAADLLRLRALASGDGGGIPLAPASSAPDAAQRPGAAHESGFLGPLLPHAERAAHRLGTAPEAVLAIAALETGWGRHVMGAPDGASSHNLFGIKRSRAAIGTVRHETTEYIGGAPRRVVADFARFPSDAAAVDAFADFILDNPRYAGALERAGDPPEFLRRLQEAGYATDPRYAEKAIALMQRIERLRETL